MSLYECRFLNHAGYANQAKVAAENDAEAIRIAQNIGANSGAHWLELWQDERSVHMEKEPGPRC
jgi:hypothetical protein